MKCIGKTKFETEAEAREGLDAVRSRPEAWERDKIPVRFYACDVCLGYHLTAMPLKRGRRKKGVISG